MRFTPLTVVRHRIQPGEPLPFNVYNDDKTLLLAKGQRLRDQDHLQSLFDRGTLADIAEVFSGAEAIAHAPPAMLGQLWQEHTEKIQQTLLDSENETFRETLDDAATTAQSLIDRDPDLAILQILRQEGNAHTQYGLKHAIHTAIISRLVAKRLSWSDDEANRAFKASLTMNVSMFELQGILANRPGRPNEEQMRQIRSHPIRSRIMLEQAGVTDSDWLLAVEQHHETSDGLGYPNGVSTPSELATLLNRADIYAAKLSPRADRDPMPADRAGRELFMRDPSNPVTAALVKEFGVYPPGAYVALASGEAGVVIRRGPTVMAPRVAVLVGKRGEVVRELITRDTSQAGYGVKGVIPAAAMKVKIEPARLAELTLA